MTATVEIRDQGNNFRGEMAEEIVLRNTAGTTLTLSTHGATVQRLAFPDRDGLTESISLYSQEIADYRPGNGFLGAIVGPYANRIAHHQFAIDGQTFALEKEGEEQHLLHSGAACLAYRLWRVESLTNDDGIARCILAISLPDGELGFPGNREIRATFSLLNDNRLTVDLEASSDKPTPISLTQHPYFNLSGASRRVREEYLSDHTITIFSGKALAVDSQLIPTGERLDIADSVLDFTHGRSPGKNLYPLDEALETAKGFDHNYCFEPWSEQHIAMARAEDAHSGRWLEVASGLPGMQFYTGNHLREAGFSAYEGFCFEPQYYPDSPNHSDFPFAFTTPDRPFQHRIEWRWGLMGD